MVNTPIAWVVATEPNRTYPDCLVVTVDCPYCGRQHTHGVYAQEYEDDTMGRRVPHCGGSHPEYLLRRKHAITAPQNG